MGGRGTGVDRRRHSGAGRSRRVHIVATCHALTTDALPPPHADDRLGPGADRVGLGLAQVRPLESRA